MRKQDIMQVLDDEIKWSEDNAEAFNTEQAAFIKGLQQAKFLIEKLYQIDAYDWGKAELPSKIYESQGE